LQVRERRGDCGAAHIGSLSIAKYVIGKAVTINRYAFLFGQPGKRGLKGTVGREGCCILAGRILGILLAVKVRERVLGYRKKERSGRL